MTILDRGLDLLMAHLFISLITVKFLNIIKLLFQF